MWRRGSLVFYILLIIISRDLNKIYHDFCYLVLLVISRRRPLVQPNLVAYAEHTGVARILSGVHFSSKC